MEKTLSQKLSEVYSSNAFPWAIISIAIVIRLVEIMNNYTLNVDEAWTALNIIHKSFVELLYPLEDYQVRPLGFLMIQKLMVLLPGNKDLLLRVVPFFCAVASSVLFYKAAQIYIKPPAIPIALGLFAVSDSLIYYSAIIKPYSCDVAVALLLFLAAVNIQSRTMPLSRFVLFGILGAIAIWLSHPAAIILVSLGIYLLISFLLEKDYSKIKKFSVVLFLWGGSLLIFLLYYLTFIKSSTSDVQQDWWIRADAFMPFPPFSLDAVKWFIKISIYMGMFSLTGKWYLFYPTFNVIRTLSLAVGTVAAVLALMGCITMIRERIGLFVMLIFPFLVNLLLSGLHLFPFAERVIVYLLPFVFLFVAQGCDLIISRKRSSYSGFIKILLVIVLFSYPVISAVYHFDKPRRGKNIIRAIDYVEANKKDGDLVYFLYVPDSVSTYYSETRGLNYAGNMDDSFTRGEFTKDELLRDLNKINGDARLWFVCSDVCAHPSVISYKTKPALDFLDSIRERVDHFESKYHGSTYLYNYRARN